MTKNTRRNTGGTPIACRCIYAIPVLLALLLSPHLIFAQTNTVIHHFFTDTKLYSTLVAPNAPNFPNETVMVGTSHYAYGVNKLHFLHINDNQAVVSSKELNFTTYSSMGTDLRAVDVVYDGVINTLYPYRYYVISQARPPAGQDAIIISKHDIDGNPVMPAMVIYSNIIGEQLYPLNAILHSNGQLYICGYVTDNSTHLPAEPGYFGYDHKKGFVIQVDPLTDAVVAAVSINTSYTFPNAATDDFDMAMSMTELKNGNIFVAGGVNNVQPSALPPFEEYHSGSMNIVMDPALNVLSDNHFAADYQNGSQGDEYSVGLMHDNFFNYQYVLSNLFGTVPGSQTFDPRPSFFCISAMPSFTPGAGPSRWRFHGFDYAWGLQTFKINDNRMIIAGLETNDWCGGSGGSNDNVRPFLFDIGVNYNTFTGAHGCVAVKWVTYESQTGTGNYTSYPNSDFWLGGGMQNLAWRPQFADRATNADDIILNAASWNTSSNLLNLKSIRVEGNWAFPDYLRDANCSGSDHVSYSTDMSNCVPFPFVDDAILPIGYPQNPVNKTYSNLNLNWFYEILDVKHFTQSDLPCNYGGGPYYKPASVTSVNNNGAVRVKLYPNPATNEITLQLEGINEDAAVHAELMNMQGQIAGELYYGRAGALATGRKMHLPEVAAGAYMVKIWNGEQLLSQQKLIIQ